MFISQRVRTSPNLRLVLGDIQNVRLVIIGRLKLVLTLDKTSHITLCEIHAWGNDFGALCEALWVWKVSHKKAINIVIIISYYYYQHSPSVCLSGFAHLRVYGFVRHISFHCITISVCLCSSQSVWRGTRWSHEAVSSTTGRVRVRQCRQSGWCLWYDDRTLCKTRKLQEGKQIDPSHEILDFT